MATRSSKLPNAAPLRLTGESASGRRVRAVPSARGNRWCHFSSVQLGFLLPGDRPLRFQINLAVSQVVQDRCYRKANERRNIRSTQRFRGGPSEEADTEEWDHNTKTDD